MTLPARDPRFTRSGDEIPDEWMKVHTLTLDVCLPCILGIGDECHTPGCAFWMQDVPRGGITDVLEHALDMAWVRSPAASEDDRG